MHCASVGQTHKLPLEWSIRMPSAVSRKAASTERERERRNSPKQSASNGVKRKKGQHWQVKAFSVVRQGGAGGKAGAIECCLQLVKHFKQAGSMRAARRQLSKSLLPPPFSSRLGKLPGSA